MAGWGEVWCTWVDSLSHPAIYPLQRQERIEYIKICFTEITKIRKKLRAAIPNKGFFAAQPSGAESINPGENIVWVACAPLSYNSLTSAAASVTNINQNNSDKRCNKNSWHMALILNLTHWLFVVPKLTVLNFRAECFWIKKFQHIYLAVLNIFGPTNFGANIFCDPSLWERRTTY